MSKFSDEERARIIAECPPPEDKLAKWRREADEQEARHAKEREEASRAAQRNVVPLDELEGRIAAAVAAERDFQHQLLAHVVARLRDEADDDLERATRSLTTELADLRSALTDLRAVLADERGKKSGDGGNGGVIDLPNPLRRLQ